MLSGKFHRNRRSKDYFTISADCEYLDRDGLTRVATVTFGILNRTDVWVRVDRNHESVSSLDGTKAVKLALSLLPRDQWPEFALRLIPKTLNDRKLF